VKYAFRWRERAVRQLRAIPQPAALTILRALTPLGDDPRRPDANVKKLSGYDDRYRLRVGDYRVIYEVVDGQLVILVVGVNSSSWSWGWGIAGRSTGQCLEDAGQCQVNQASKGD